MGNFSNLPTDIVLDIITRLPTESILDCKLVCKPWKYLVSQHPSFYQTYLTHLNRSTADSSGKLSFLVFTEDYKLYHFDFDEKHDDETPAHRIRRINFNHPFVCHCYMVIGSINGLVCLFGGNENAFCVWNPVTREYVMLPKFYRDREDQYRRWSCGFGYLPTTNEYKVAVLNSSETEMNFLEVAVYTLGSGKGWRTVERLNAGLAKVHVAGHVGAFVNGALHWEDHQEGKLLAFDLTKEKFREHVKPPPCPSIRGWSRFTVGVFDGVLYYVIERKCSDIWLLKKKNDIRDMKGRVEHEQLGWSKEFSLPLGEEPLAFTKSGNVLYFNFGSLSIYDAATSTLKTLVDFSHLSLFNRIFPHKVTLLSLKELGEENVQVMQPANIEEAETPDLF